MKVRKLRNIATIAAGQSAPQGENNYCDNGIPFIRAGNLVELLNGKKESELQKVNEIVAKKHKLKLYPAGTVLFAKSGMSCMKGHVYQLKTPCYVVSHLACIMAKEISGEYLKYYFEFNKPNLLVKDEAYPSISLADIGEMDICYGDIGEQQKIIETLNEVSKIIELRHLQLKKLDLLVKSKFIEMFGMPNKTQHGWVTEKLLNHLEVIGGYAFKSDNFKNEGIPVLRIGNINSGRFQATNLVFWQYDATLKKYILHPGDLVISLTGTVGKDDYANVCILGNDYEMYYLNQRNARLKLRDSLNKLYLAQLLKFPEIKSKLTNISRGVRQANVANQDILNLSVSVPPIDLQNEFASFVEQTDKAKSKIKQSLEKFDILKKALMQKYFG